MLPRAAHCKDAWTVAACWTLLDDESRNVVVQYATSRYAPQSLPRHRHGSEDDFLSCFVDSNAQCREIRIVSPIHTEYFRSRSALPTVKDRSSDPHRVLSLNCKSLSWDGRRVVQDRKRTTHKPQSVTLGSESEKVKRRERFGSSESSSAGQDVFGRSNSPPPPKK